MPAATTVNAAWPTMPSADPTICVCPGESAAIAPVAETLAIAGFDDVHVTAPAAMDE